ncbi:MAG: imidazole glycerol phosphate synthase subunit HisH [Proteobacteria bacterium]|nr:imidazole glycerol phosphate synthase subunit HisH [Pseudomonadota bacterium]MDA1131674.1 imidazole glycerol phosphate synthase subunit HisH [Pseudomonadota bacterium]
MIGIVDYGLGNLTSVAAAVAKVGHTPRVTGDAAELWRSERLILPGVGAFGDGMRRLRELGLVEPLTRMVVEEGKPILGICLGSQLLARESEEFGTHEGLGWIDATVRRLAPGDDELRIPHVGWNDLDQVGESPLFADVPETALFYYVHSYRLVVDQPGIVVGSCTYGSAFPSVIQAGNIFATQFHPEKSQRHGLLLLQNFLERVH